MSRSTSLTMRSVLRRTTLGGGRSAKASQASVGRRSSVRSTKVARVRRTGLEDGEASQISQCGSESLTLAGPECSRPSMSSISCLSSSSLTTPTKPKLSVIRSFAFLRDHSKSLCASPRASLPASPRVHPTLSRGGGADDDDVAALTGGSVSRWRFPRLRSGSAKPPRGPTLDDEIQCGQAGLQRVAVANSSALSRQDDSAALVTRLRGATASAHI